MSDLPPTSPTTVSPSASAPGPKRTSVLDWIEWIGNKLPDPVTLFAIGALLVMVLSWAADHYQWNVVQEMPRAVTEQVIDEAGNPVMDENGEPVMREAVDPETGQPLIEWYETGVVFEPFNLLSRDGIDWIFREMVNNFRNFPPLGVVLVGMLGIGVAERTGLLGAALKGFMHVLRGGLESFTPRDWGVADKILTPAMVFIGIMSSLATDAGYVVLPPLAAALYKSVGRSPLAGMAAVFAGVSAGFSANLVITGLEPMLAELTAAGSRIIDQDYAINPACNWWFMIGSTVLITFTGWAVTALFVERRLKRRSAEEGGPAEPTEEELAEQQLKPHEIRGLGWAGVAGLAFAVAALCLILIPGAPLHTYKLPVVQDGRTVIIPADNAAVEQWEEIIERREREAAKAEDADLVRVPRLRWEYAERWDVTTQGPPPAETAYHPDELTVLVKSPRRFARWVDAIVPLLFFGFIIPGIAYGRTSGEIKSDKDVAKLMMDSMAAMAPIIVLAFVAGQFIFWFGQSNLDKMLAITGGTWLGKAGFSPYMLIVAFILVTLFFNLFMGSMSAKYTLFAPIFVPMFMLAQPHGISPELTQAAYRVGDSVSNIITPLNAYLIIILVFMQRYVPKGGMGTLIATMFPYTLVFTVIWTIFLLLWMWTGQPLGVDGPLWYSPPVN